MALAFLLPVKMMAKASSSDNSTLLWYNAPAQQWLEALPIGNSHLGGMVYGDFGITLLPNIGWRLYL